MDIPELMKLHNYDDEGFSYINPAQVSVVVDLPKSDKHKQRTRVDMIGSRNRWFLVKETATEVDIQRLSIRGRKQMGKEPHPFEKV